MRPILHRAAPLLVVALLALAPAVLAQTDPGQGLLPPGSGADLVQDRGVPQPGETPIPYVIVTTRALRPAFLELGRARIRNGIRSAVRSLESLQAAYPNATDDPERIRQFLRDAHDIWGTRYVLLGGDSDVLPPRFVDQANPFLGELHFVSDWYFACLDGTWDADHDGRYGESPEPGGDPGDQPDLVPELYLGRAPVSSPQEARRFVDKTIGYEERPDDGLENRTLLFASRLGGGVLDFAMFSEMLLPFITDDPAQVVTRLYESWDSPFVSPGALPETPSSVLEAFNQGANVAIGFGGGSEVLLVAGPEPGPDPYLDVPRVMGLANGSRTGHLILLTSLVSAFDTPTSLGEAFLKAPNGGAVTVIAPSELTFSGMSNALVRRLVELVYEQGVATIGEALVSARANLVPGDWTLPMSYQLLGDPMLRVFSSSPVASAVGGGEHGRTGITGRTPDREEVPPADLVAAIRPEAPRPPVARDAETHAADDLALSAPVPSPSRSGARIALTVPQALTGTTLDARVIDLAGRTVRVLARGTATPGATTLAWDLRSEQGERVRPGVYFLHVTAGGARRTGRLVVTDGSE